MNPDQQGGLTSMTLHDFIILMTLSIGTSRYNEIQMILSIGTIRGIMRSKMGLLRKIIK